MVPKNPLSLRKVVESLFFAFCKLKEVGSRERYLTTELLKPKNLNYNSSFRRIVPVFQFFPELCKSIDDFGSQFSPLWTFWYFFWNYSETSCRKEDNIWQKIRWTKELVLPVPFVELFPLSWLFQNYANSCTISLQN